MGTGGRGRGQGRATRAAPRGVMGARGAVDSGTPKNFLEWVRDG